MIPVSVAASILGVTPCRVQVLCRQRRIPGARLVGRVWMIPVDFVVIPCLRGPALRCSQRLAENVNENAG